MSTSGHGQTEPAAAGGIVSLTTDFGIAEPFVGLVKAQILARNPTARIVDLTHGVAPYNTEAAAFWVERSYRFFGAGSLHLVVVDPGVGTDRRILLVSLGDQLFLAPDNGVLGTVAAAPGAVVRSAGVADLGGLSLPEPSPTFHGRDLFGPLAGELSRGRLGFASFGVTCADWVRPSWTGPVAGPDTICGRVILVDNFGNVFSNIPIKALVNSSIASVVFGDHELPLVRTYGDRPAGSFVALVNAFGVLEAACVEGRACDRLGLGPGAPVKVRLRR